jgi:uncharacterized protein with PIN domain
MSENRDFAELFAIRRCPICGGELEKGYIASKGMVWDTVKQGLITHSKENQEILTPTFAWSITNFPTLRCRNCNILIFKIQSKSSACENMSHPHK